MVGREDIGEVEFTEEFGGAAKHEETPGRTCTCLGTVNSGLGDGESGKLIQVVKRCYSMGCAKRRANGDTQ